MSTPCTLSASISNCAPERGAETPWGCDRGGGQAADAISPLPCCGGFRGCAPVRAIVDSVIFIVITKIREALPQRTQRTQRNDEGTRKRKFGREPQIYHERAFRGKFVVLFQICVLLSLRRSFAS